MSLGEQTLVGTKYGNAHPKRSRYARTRALVESLEVRSLLSSAIAGVLTNPSASAAPSEEIVRSSTSTTLPAPTATSPGSTTTPGPVLTTSTPTFEWTPVTGDTALTGYQINLFDNTLSQSYSYQVGASVSSYTLASGVLTAGDSFVWNVRILEGTTSGPPSSYFYFQAPAAVALPAPVAAGQGSTTAPGPQLDPSAATFQWDAVTPFTGFTGYQVNAYDETSKTSYSFKVGTSVTSYTAPSSDLTPGDDFVWNVRVIDGSTTGPESAYLNFVVPAAVTLPAPIAVGQGSTATPYPTLDTSAATFQWDAVTSATGLTGYQINLYNQTTGTSYSYTVGTSVTSYTAPSSVLTPGDTFVWNVRILEGTVGGPPSAYLSFIVPAAATLPAPVATSPGSTTKPGPVLTTDAPTLSWQPVTGVTGLTGYQIYLTDETASKTFSYQTGASVTSYAVPAGTLTAGDTFVWDVRILVGTQSGPPSSYLYFQTPAATVTLPAPVATGQGSTTTPYPTLDTSAATFQWNAVGGVTGLTGYQINLYNSTTSTSYSYTVGASITSYTAPSSVLVAGDSYVWNVRVLAGNTSGPPSAYLNFIVPAAATLPAPVATSPGSTTKPGPVLTTSTPTLSWQAVTGVTNLTGYQIYLTDETAGKTFSYQTGASVDSFTVPSGTLASGDTFVWDVRIIAGTQDGPPSTYLYFQTPGGTSSANPPSVTTVIAAATAKLTHVEALQHKVVKSLKTATPGTTAYKDLKQQYDVWEKRIKELKIERADLEAEM